MPDKIIALIRFELARHFFVAPIKIFYPGRHWNGFPFHIIAADLSAKLLHFLDEGAVARWRIISLGISNLVVEQIRLRDGDNQSCWLMGLL